MQSEEPSRKRLQKLKLSRWPGGNRPKHTRPRRAAYALPALFTAGNIFLGFLSLLQSFEAVMLANSGHLGFNPHFRLAAVAIGVAVFLDGLDGRIARLTNTVSEFGRELDSLADVITFGVAPAVLAFTWGVAFVDGNLGGDFQDHLRRAGYFLAFLFLLCGAARLARFNIQVDPVPKNPGRPDRKYFVGLPIPAAAGMIAAVIYAAGSEPLEWWAFAVGWLALLGVLAVLMVSTWRYRSFKDLNLLRPRSPRSVVILGSFIYLMWNYSRAMLLAIAVTYVGSGIAVRIGGVLRRRFHRARPTETRAADGTAQQENALATMVRSGKVVIVGESMLSREVRDVFSERDPQIEIETAGILEGDTILTERGGEPSLIMGVNKEMMSSSDAIVLSGPATASHRVLEMHAEAGGISPALIDLSYALEDQPGARLRAPLADNNSEPNDLAEATQGPTPIYVIAHPAATILALFFRSLRARFAVTRWVVHVFEPASERGKPGIDELHQQTVDLFSFRTLPKQVFDEQLTFNMLGVTATKRRTACKPSRHVSSGIWRVSWRKRD